MELFVTIPDELKALLAVLVTVLVTELLKELGKAVNVDLSGYNAKITASIVGAVLVYVNAALTNVPAQLIPVVNQLFILAVLVFASFGVYKSLKK